MANGRRRPRQAQASCRRSKKQQNYSSEAYPEGGGEFCPPFLEGLGALGRGTDLGFACNRARARATRRGAAGRNPEEAKALCKGLRALHRDPTVSHGIALTSAVAKRPRAVLSAIG